MIEQSEVQLKLFAMVFFFLGTALGMFVGWVIRKAGEKTEILVDKDLGISSIIHHHAVQ